MRIPALILTLVLGLASSSFAGFSAKFEGESSDPALKRRTVYVDGKLLRVDQTRVTQRGHSRFESYLFDLEQRVLIGVSPASRRCLRTAALSEKEFSTTLVLLSGLYLIGNSIGFDGQPMIKTGTGFHEGLSYEAYEFKGLDGRKATLWHSSEFGPVAIAHDSGEPLFTMKLSEIKPVQLKSDFFYCPADYQLSNFSSEEWQVFQQIIQQALPASSQKSVAPPRNRTPAKMWVPRTSAPETARFRIDEAVLYTTSVSGETRRQIRIKVTSLGTTPLSTPYLGLWDTETGRYLDENPTRFILKGFHVDPNKPTDPLRRDLFQNQSGYLIHDLASTAPSRLQVLVSLRNSIKGVTYQSASVK